MRSANLVNRVWTKADQLSAEEELGRNRAQQLSRIVAGGRHHRAQHRARVWEYDLALRAGAMTSNDQLVMYSEMLWLDVGGAGSPLAWLVADIAHTPVQIIDPEFNGLGIGVDDKANNVRLLAGKADFISCISVLEHVEDEPAFLQDLTALLAPGGVLLLTTDYVDEAPAGDTFHFHWMRKRIYTRSTFYGVNGVFGTLASHGLKVFGELDTTPGDPIEGLGYSFASLCMQRPK